MRLSVHLIIDAAIIALTALIVHDSQASIRKTSVRHAFMRSHPCPSKKPHSKYTCPGYIIDDIVPVDCGGKDVVENKQWMTTAEAAAKDKWERNGPECRHRTHGVKP